MSFERSPCQLAVVGFGLVGRRHVESIALAEGVELAALVDPVPAVKAEAEKLGVPFYSSLEELFSAGAPDGIILATPTQLHIEQALLCIKQGCPVLVEKPLGVSVAESRTLVDAAQAASVPVLVGHHRRHNPIIQRAKAIIESGQIGQVRAVHATCWLYKPDEYFDQALWRKEPGAGPISVNLVHDVDLIRYLCGEVAEVSAFAAPALRGYDNEDLAAAVLRFETGAIGTLSVSDAIPSPWSWELTAQENPAYAATQQSCYHIGGSLGSLSVPDLTVWQHQQRPDWWQPMSATVQPREHADPLVNQVEHFAAVIAGLEEPLVSALEGLKTLRVIEAIQAGGGVLS